MVGLEREHRCTHQLSSTLECPRLAMLRLRTGLHIHRMSQPRLYPVTPRLTCVYCKGILLLPIDSRPNDGSAVHSTCHQELAGGTPPQREDGTSVPIQMQL
jgi:hypothetical protein